MLVYFRDGMMMVTIDSDDDDDDNDKSDCAKLLAVV